MKRFLWCELRCACLRLAAPVLCAAVLIGYNVPSGDAFEILGIGTASLLGGDLTDPENDGDETAYNPPVDFGGFDAEFFSSDEPGFGGGEFAYNVFDNLVGPSNDKWCCGTMFPQIVGAKFAQPFVLTHFTVTSGNDTDDRRPRVWTVDGSQDGLTWETIFSQNDPSAPLWDAHNQVIRFDSGPDFPAQSVAYTQFRVNVTATGATTGAFFQINEIEFFGRPADIGIPGDVNLDDVVDIEDYRIIRDNMGTSNGRALGDLNFSGRIGIDDFRIWKDVFSAPAAVPEPAAFSLLLAAVMTAVFYRRRNRIVG